MLKLPDPPKPEVTNQAIRKAIELLSSECYGALRVCAMLGGIRRSATFRYANREITDEERHRIFYKSVKVTGIWPE